MNLALEVLGKRGDGYHEIATVLQAVDLFDRLTMETADTLSLHVDDPELPTDEGNLVMRAARLLQKTAGIEKGAQLRLQKRIPVAAGLGGLERRRRDAPGPQPAVGAQVAPGPAAGAGGGARHGRAVLPGHRPGGSAGAR